MDDLSKIRTAFILGAGLGTRLRPLTENCPKPLLPVGGRPLITYAMDHCLSIGVERFIVNTHHCAAAYDTAFPGGNWRGTPILFRHEPVLLDTAGGLKNIEDLLEEDETILVYNGDILTDLPLARLLAAHAAGGREVTLALRSDGPLRNVCLDAKGEDLRFSRPPRESRRPALPLHGDLRRGEAVSPASDPGKIESVVPVFAEMIREAPGSVASVVIDEGGTWRGVCGRLVRRRTRPRESKVASAAVSDRRWGRISPPVRERMRRRMRRRNCRPSTGEREETGPQASAFIRETLGLAAGTRVEMAPVGKGGSDRDYFRVAAAGRTPAILMRYGRMYEENDLLCGRRLLSQGNRRDAFPRSTATIRSGG